MELGTPQISKPSIAAPLSSVSVMKNATMDTAWSINVFQDKEIKALAVTKQNHCARYPKRRVYKS